MFERFVTRFKHLQLHRQGPARDERERYLRHLADEGRSMETYQHAAGYILHAAVLLNLNSRGIVSEERSRKHPQGLADNRAEAKPEKLSQNLRDFGSRRPPGGGASLRW